MWLFKTDAVGDDNNLYTNDGLICLDCISQLIANYACIL